MADESVDQYANSLFGGEDALLRAMREEAEREGLPAIQVPSELGRILTLLILATGAKRVLEIGTLFGYSAVLIGRALPEDGHLTTLEVNPKHAALASRNLEKAGLSNRVTIREGDAHASLAELRGETFDFVFIDADKDSYPEYLQAALELTVPGSVIIADNVWRHGSVVDPQDGAAEGAARFNRDLAAESRLYSTIISTRDGGDAASVSVVKS